MAREQTKGEEMETVGFRSAVVGAEPEVRNLLEACEVRIERALEDAWHALREIHDNKLYKVAGYKTFEDYAEKRWGYSKSHAYRLIEHAKIVDHLKAEGIATLPQGEGVTRPLMKLKRIAKSEDDFLQRATEAWQIATDTAPKILDAPNVTVDHVESSMQHFGLYRNAKKSDSSSAAASDLRDLLTRLGRSDAVKMTPDAFAKRFEGRGFPNDFGRTLTWLTRAFELTGASK